MNFPPPNLPMVFGVTVPSYLGAAATYTGTTRDSNSEFHTYAASVTSPTDGTFYVDQSNDGSTWATTGTAAVATGATVNISVPVMARYTRIRFLNGSTVQSTGVFAVAEAFQRV